MVCAVGVKLNHSSSRGWFNIEDTTDRIPHNARATPHMYIDTRTKTHGGQNIL